MIDPRTGKNIVAAPQAPAVTPPILRAPQALPTTPAVTPAPPATTSHGAFVTDPGTGQPYGPQAGWSPGFQKFGQDMTQGLVAPAVASVAGVARQPRDSATSQQPAGGPIPAAQAATPPAVATQAAMPGPANGGAAGGVYAYGDSKQAFAFRHPLTGREHPYLTREQAEAGLAAESARMQTPEGKAEVVRALNNRPLNLTSDGKIPEGTFNPQEMALVAPELARTGLDGGKAQGLGGDPSVTIASPAPAASAGASDGVDVIRGTKVSRAGGGATGGGSAEGLRNDIASRVQYGIDAGSPLGAYGPELAFLKGIPQETAKGSGLPTLSQVQGQWIAQHPELITSPQQLLGKEAATPNRKIISQPGPPQEDEKGNLTGLPGEKKFYSVDPATGEALPLDLSGGAGQEGGVGQAPPPHPLNQSPQAVAIRAAVRAGRMTPAEAKKQWAALAQQPAQ